MKIDYEKIESMMNHKDFIEYVALNKKIWNKNELIEVIYCAIINGVLESIEDLCTIGFNINSKGEWGSEGATTLIDVLCEWRALSLIESAIKCGAKVTPKTLICLLFGHGYYAKYDVQECEECLRLLVNLNLPIRKVIYKWYLDEDEVCSEYIKKSEFIKKFLESCKIIDDKK